MKDEFLQVVFDTIPHFVMIKNLDGTYRKVNKAFADSYGKTPADFKNVHPYDLGLLREEIDNFLAMDREVIRTGLKVTSDGYTLTYPDGRKTYQRSVRLPLKDKKGRVIGIVVDVEDITEIRKLQNQKCESMKKEIIGEMAAELSHEFSNILQIIKSNVENIQDLKVNRDYFKTVFSVITRGETAIHTLQNFQFNKNIKIEMI